MPGILNSEFGLIFNIVYYLHMNSLVLSHKDLEVSGLIEREVVRQQETVTLIPSENYASKAVREAVASILMNKYSEGYPGRRYYEGNEVVDEIELLAIERAKKLFGVVHANVQSYSGSPANSAILFALAESGDAIMGLSLSSGGHLTHGHPRVTFSGKYFKSVQFGTGEDGRIDYEKFESLASETKPKIIFLGTTAYPFLIDWKRAGDIADACGAYLVADISHEAGLVAAGATPNPVPFAHVLMCTTHKSLRGPRGAMIMVTEKGLQKDVDLAKKIDSAVMPGLQGGPHNNTTAAIAVALHEADTDEFRDYSKQVLLNAQVLASRLKEKGLKLVGEGTENHLMILDFSSVSEGFGTLVSIALNAAGIVTNRNTVPGDPSPFYPSGLRLGTPAVTTRGMKEKEMHQIAEWISEVVEAVKDYKLPEEKVERANYIQELRGRLSTHEDLLKIKQSVKELCDKFQLL